MRDKRGRPDAPNQIRMRALTIGIHQMKKPYLVISIFLSACVTQPKQPPKPLSQFKLENPTFRQNVNTAPPLKLIPAAPIFPMKAASEKQQGWCVVIFDVATDGSTRNHRLMECSPTGYFEKAAMESAQQIRVENPPKEQINGVSYVFQWNIAQ